MPAPAIGRSRVVIDLETCSLLDLPKVGTHVYAEHPSTRITVLCFAVDAGPVETWTGGPVPEALGEALRSGATVVAHNYFFELCLWRAKLVPLGWPEIPLERWSCTMARALVAGLPAGLESAGAAAGLELRKDASARSLMLRFARPRSHEPLTWWHETDPERFQRLKEYCAQDVIAERALDRAVPELSDRERAIFDADHRLNERGLRIDKHLVSQMSELAVVERTRINVALRRVTGGAVTAGTQVQRITQWLAHQGVTTASLDREAVTTLLQQNDELPEDARAVLQGRLDISRASTAKLVAIEHRLGADGRLRGTVQFYGANRTGRWAGRGLQGQNLPRGTIKDIAGAVAMIRDGVDLETLDLLFEDSPMGVLASCLRAVIEAAPGHVLVAADLSQIEARVLCWLTGQRDTLAVFERGDDVYTYTAARLGSPIRQLGKVIVLAVGFGMGPFRFRETARGYGLKLAMEVAERTVYDWRDQNRQTVDYWHALGDCAIQMTGALTGTERRFGVLTFIRRAYALLIRLPSGRHLVYRDPQVQTGRFDQPEFTYMGNFQGQWTRLRSWGGKLTENIVQAIARDVMAEAMILADRKGLPLVATVHDELVVEVPEQSAEGVRAWLLWAMRRRLDWAPDLPVDAAATISRRYQKA